MRPYNINTPSGTTVIITLDENSDYMLAAKNQKSERLPAMVYISSVRKRPFYFRNSLRSSPTTTQERHRKNNPLHHRYPLAHRQPHGRLHPKKSQRQLPARHTALPLDRRLPIHNRHARGWPSHYLGFFLAAASLINLYASLLLSRDILRSFYLSVIRNCLLKLGYRVRPHYRYP